MGVDVFFVISGFLITGIILEELRETKRFSIWNFYVRRSRRILPALLMVVLASIVAAYFILLPSELKRFAVSIFASLGFFSNIYWFIELGEYGAKSGLLQPMLHTWSLAIEEQFYLFFPLLMLMIKPGNGHRRTLVILCVLFFLSLILAEMTTWWKKDLSFFFPASRAWELLVGSILALAAAYFPQVMRPGQRMSWLLPKLALVILIISMVTIDLAAVAHPGLITIPCVFATAALIWFARPGESVTSLLSTQPMVFIGKLSYSIYLWHFPIFAFGRLSSFETPGFVDKAAWVGLTLLCAIAGYYLIEKRFRFAISSRIFVASLVSSIAIIGAFIIAVTVADLPKRGWIAELTTVYGVNSFDNEALRDESWRLLDDLAGKGEKIGKWNAHRPSNNERNNLWFDNPSALKVLIVGNSHSKDMFNALASNSARFPGMQFARFTIASNFPKNYRAQLFASANFKASDVVMISTRYNQKHMSALRDFILDIQNRGKNVVLVGNTPEFKSPAPLPIFDLFIRRQGSAKNLSDVNLIAFNSEDTAISELNMRIRNIARETDSLYLSRRDIVCSDPDEACYLVTSDGRKSMYDYGHWTLEGAAYFGERAAQINWLGSLQKD